MIKLEKTDVFGWETSIRGLRNPMNSWDKSDSDFSDNCYNQEHEGECTDCKYFDGYGRMCIPHIGENDLKLMKNLSKAGSDHAKYLRMINVTVDITAPLYWWKEFDTYKVGTVANSCSTMHKIHTKEFIVDDFSCEHLSEDNLVVLKYLIVVLNDERKKFLDTKEKDNWWQMIQLLPSSYNQKRTIQLNYQVLKNMYFSRRNHKLDEWHIFCEWCEGLPYFKEICIDVEEKK